MQLPENDANNEHGECKLTGKSSLTFSFIYKYSFINNIVYMYMYQ